MASIEVGHSAPSGGGKPVRWSPGEVPGIHAVAQSLGMELEVRSPGPPQSGQLLPVEGVLDMAGAVRLINPSAIPLREAKLSLSSGSFHLSFQAVKA